jgi:hypothetical protein
VVQPLVETPRPWFKNAAGWSLLVGGAVGLHRRWCAVCACQRS